MKHFLRACAAGLFALASLSGCGLHPLYSGGAGGPVARGIGHVEVAAIEGKGGWLVRNALIDRLSPLEQAAGGPAYRLVVRLNDQILGSGVRFDDSVTRERRTLRARYQLIDAATGVQIIDTTAGADAGLDVTSSEYATIAAEDTALERLAQIIADQIVTHMAQRAARNGGDAALAPAMRPATAP
jgi:LPS-assembly lipoprotein